MLKSFLRIPTQLIFQFNNQKLKSIQILLFRSLPFFMLVETYFQQLLNCQLQIIIRSV